MANSVTQKQEKDGTGTYRSDEPQYRMRDLIRESGLPRKTIHYYISEGLLPTPRKSGRNSALYGVEHLERLKQISELREQQFLPIKAIKAIYDVESDIDLSEQQMKYLRGLGLGLPKSIRPGLEEYVNLEKTLNGKLNPQEIKVLEEKGLISPVDSEDGTMVCKEDAVIAQSWIDIKNLGFTPEKGYEPGLFSLWDKAIEALVVKEITLLASGMSRNSEAESLEITAKTMAIVNKLIDALHHKKTRSQFKKIYGQEKAAPAPSKAK